MPHSKAAASPVQNLEVTLAPSTPKRGTKRGVEAGEDAETPNAMRRTVSLPQSFDMGTINLKTTTENMRAQTGRDLDYGLVPDNAIIKTKILYNKSKAKIGSNVIIVTKDEEKGIVSVCWYTNPWQIGGEVVKVLNKRVRRWLRRGLQGALPGRALGRHRQRPPDVLAPVHSETRLDRDAGHVWLCRRRRRLHQGALHRAPQQQPADGLLPRGD